MIAIVCPGQGSQKPGFLAPWLDDEKARDRLDRLSAAADLDLVHYGTEADEETIRDTAIAQPLIVAAGLLAGSALKNSPAYDSSRVVFAGHSVGEITAAALSGVVSEEDAMRFIRVRSRGMAEAAAAEKTGMAAVLGGVENEVRAAIESAGLSTANMNGAGQIVAAGTLDDLASFAQNPPAKTRVIPLKVAGAFHTVWMQPAVEPLANFAQTLSPRDPQGILLSNRDGGQLTDGQAVIDSLVSQLTRPVRWDLCMQTLVQQEVTSLLELSPAGTLVGLAKRAMRGVPGIPLNSPSDLEAAYSALGA